jgi:hypothetical protein
MRSRTDALVTAEIANDRGDAPIVVRAVREV